MKRLLRILFIPLVVVSAFLLVGNFFIFPWLLLKIRHLAEEKISQSQLVKIELKNLDVQLFPPQATLSDISIKGLSPDLEVIKKMHLQEIRAEISPFALLIGRLELNRLVVEGLDAEVEMAQLPQSKEAKPLPMEDMFQFLGVLPLQKIEVDVKRVKFKLDDPLMEVEIGESHLAANNMKKHVPIDIRVNVLAANFQTSKAPSEKDHKTDSHPESSSVKLQPIMTELSADLSKDELKISQFELQSYDSQIQLKGLARDFKNIAIHPQLSADVSTHIELKSLNSLIAQFTHSSVNVRGAMHSDGRVEVNGFDQVKGEGKISTHEVFIGDIEVGSADLKATGDVNGLDISEFRMKHRSGEALLKSTHLKFQSGVRFSTNLEVQKFDLQQLFQSLDLRGIPVELTIRGGGPCQGQINSVFEIECQPSIEANGLDVRSGMKGATIVALDNMKAKGTVKITQQDVQYDAQIQLPNSKGKSKGVVDFDDGFQIDYSAEKLDTGDIKNLIGLKWGGVFSLEGSTEGDSSAATMKLKTQIKDFALDKYFLGDVKANLGYAAGHLIIDKVDAQLGKSEYKGGIDINIARDSISGRFEMPSLFLEDVGHSLEGLYELPFQAQGFGRGKVEFEGPLDFWKLKYQLDTDFTRVVLGSDLFDLLRFHVSSDGHEVKTEDVSVVRGHSVARVSGAIVDGKTAELALNATQFRVEEVSLFSRFNNQLSGVLNFSGGMNGALNNPLLTLHGTVTESFLDATEVPSSTWDLKIEDSLLALELNMFGNAVQGLVQLPLGKSQQSARIELETQKFDVAPWINLIIGSPVVSEYEMRLSGRWNLESKKGTWDDLTGTVDLPQLLYRRGKQRIVNPRPMKAVFHDGDVQLSQFVLAGDGSSIEILGDHFTLNDLKVKGRIQTNLSYALMFVPFLEDINGTLGASFTLAGPIRSPTIVGSLKVTDGFAKIRGLLDPFEKVQIDSSFSASKMQINSLQFNLGGGAVTGDGTIQFRGVSQIPMNIRTQFSNVSLNIPDKVRTTGSGSISLTGNTFPYMLSGNYIVQSGLFAKEFASDESNTVTLKQSSYLPRFLKQKGQESLNFDIQVNMEKGVAIKNSLMEGNLTGNLFVKGTPSFPILLGNISFVKGTKLTFKDKIFDIQNSLIKFTNPTEIDPELFMSAQSRIGDYDISLQASGNSKHPNFKLTSVPPLSEQEIITLLAFGVTSSQLDERVHSKEQQNQSGFEIGAAIFSNNPLNKKIKDTFGLDLQLTSSFDSTRNISVPKFTASRRLNEKLNASASRSIGGEISTMEFELRYLLNQNVSAVGTYKSTETENPTLFTDSAKQNQSIFGVDLEFKRDFR